jgi:hypothetical protein
MLMFLIFSLAIFMLGVIVTFNAVVNAPEGVQHDEGFRFKSGNGSNPTGRIPRLKRKRAWNPAWMEVASAKEGGACFSPDEEV